MDYIKKLYNGRINRISFFSGMIISGILLITIGIIALVAVLYIPKPFGFILMVLLISITFLMYLIIRFGIVVRRLHDLGESGWLSILTIVPMINLLAVLYLLFGKGEIGQNKYGEEPAPGATLKEIFRF